MLRILTLWAIFFTSVVSVNLVNAADEASSNSPKNTTNFYVSDDIGVVLRSGPTNRYRVTGKIAAGTPITILQSDTANDSSEVRVANVIPVGSKPTILPISQPFAPNTNSCYKKISN